MKLLFWAVVVNEHGAAVAHLFLDRFGLDVEHPQDVRGVGGKRRQVAERVVQVLVVALQRNGELLLPLLERRAGRCVERVVDV
jgi:hypothetical protein